MCPLSDGGECVKPRSSTWTSTVPFRLPGVFACPGAEFFLTSTQHGHLNPYVPVVNALETAGSEVAVLLLSADGGALDEQRREALGKAEVQVVGKVEMAPWSGDPAKIGPMLQSSPVADQTA